MQQLDITADELVRGLLKLAETEHVSILDSGGVGQLGSHLLIVGVDPLSVEEHDSIDGEASLAKLQNAVDGSLASIFTISYDLGRKLQGLAHGLEMSPEPDAFVAQYDTLIVHDYNTGITGFSGRVGRFKHVVEKLRSVPDAHFDAEPHAITKATSDLSKDTYLEHIQTIMELIRDGTTYQTNLTQQISVKVGEKATPESAFYSLRRDHPAPLAAYIKRLDSTVVSASPERFFRVNSPHVSKGSTQELDSLNVRESTQHARRITTSPIKGTRRRGLTRAEDTELKHDLLTSSKDRAENTMIVDLLRNDLGRVCEYGSVIVEKLCELEEHPTLFHLVSTVSGNLRDDASFSNVIRALFPCGSITGAPKMSTMRIIDEHESTPRGLSMGAIGCSIPKGFDGLDPVIDLSVAIRTMVFRDGVATFNVGGGITIDSDPHDEYEESLLKAKALLAALNAEL